MISNTPSNTKLNIRSMTLLYFKIGLYEYLNVSKYIFTHVYNYVIDIAIMPYMEKVTVVDKRQFLNFFI